MRLLPCGTSLMRMVKAGAHGGAVEASSLSVHDGRRGEGEGGPRGRESERGAWTREERESLRA
eukprot:3661312-Pleurochrysis_carterae.AAC.1